MSSKITFEDHVLDIKILLDNLLKNLDTPKQFWEKSFKSLCEYS